MNDVVELNLAEFNVNYKMYLPNSQTNLIERIITHTKKPYEYEMLKSMARQLNRVDPSKNTAVLDVGMNLGNHALFFAALGYRVIGIEANPKMSEIAKKSIQINGFDNLIKVIECGVSDKNEICHFDCEIPENFGGMSMAKSHEENATGGGAANLSNSLSVQCCLIDDLNINEKISLIKMDIEGMEPAALRGAKKLIAKNTPLIYLESQKIQALNENADILEALNYTHFAMWDMGAPMHLFMHLSAIDENLWRQKIARDMAILRLNHSSTPQGVYLENLLTSFYNEQHALKDQLLYAFIQLIGGQFNGQNIQGKINEILEILKK